VPQLTSQGNIGNGQTIAIPVAVAPGWVVAEFRLGWREDWGSFPTNDIDLILVSPTGAVNTAAATLSNPEVASIKTPAAGTWIAYILGYDVASVTDKWEFRVALDGKVIK